MPLYTSFLLRVWRSDLHESVQWSAKLEGLQDGRQRQFHSADALLAYLRLLLDPDALSGPDPPVGTERP